MRAFVCVYVYVCVSVCVGGMCASVCACVRLCVHVCMRARISDVCHESFSYHISRLLIFTT